MQCWKLFGEHYILHKKLPEKERFLLRVKYLTFAIVWVYSKTQQNEGRMKENEGKRKHFFSDGF